MTTTSAGQALYARARGRIPGGTQLLSKRPEILLPEQWPTYFGRARGAEVWDLDGSKYIDFAYCAIGAAVLGVADPDVDRAVGEAISHGTVSTLMCPEEVELADLLCELHPWAERVRYGRAGGEAMAIAVRIARAATGRDVVAFCGYHGWSDWYVAANLGAEGALDGHLMPGLPPRGVPRALAGTAFPFRYNELGELEAIVAAHGANLAAIVMEPMRSDEPKPGFLEGVRSLATRSGAVLIVDEITAGWRMNTGGMHLTLGLRPDIAVFAKAISNGYAMSAIVGTAAAMEPAQESFISSTAWTERIGPTAALATIRKHRDREVWRHLIAIGRRVQEGWRAAAASAGVPALVYGIPPLGHLAFDAPDSQALRTLFTQEMLGRGYLATGAFYATYAHTEEQVDRYLEETHEAFRVVAGAIERGDARRLLKGPVARTGFFRLTR